MCWNWQVSLITFIIVTTISYKLYKRNLKYDRFLAIFILSYGTMQLVEFFIWIAITNNIPILNKIASLIGSIVLFSHPLAIVVGLYFDKSNKDNKLISKSNFRNLILICLTIILFNLYQIITTKKHKFLTYVHDTVKHLVWDFPHSNYMTLVLTSAALIVYILIYFNSKPTFYMIIIYYFVGIVISSKFFVENIFSFKYGLAGKYFGSYWCWVVAFFSIILYFINKKINNKINNKKDKLSVNNITI